MVQIEISYQGSLRTRAEHGPSKASLVTDAPVDNHGKGESFSPTDLLATALGTCMITVMGIFARKNGFDLDGSQVRVVKEMTKEPPRRVERLVSEISVPASIAQPLDEKTRQELIRIARNCPVRLSLLPAIQVPLVIRFGEEVRHAEQ